MMETQSYLQIKQNLKITYIKNPKTMEAIFVQFWNPNADYELHLNFAFEL